MGTPHGTTMSTNDTRVTNGTRTTGDDGPCTYAEPVEIVDENGNTVGIDERTVARRDGLRHRIALVAVIDDNGTVLCHRRSEHRPSSPGQWDICAGGAVDPAEDPAAAARRELREELGIEGEPHELGAGPWSSGNSRRWIHTYVVHSNAAAVPDPEEVAETRRLGRDAIEALIGEAKICEDSRDVLWPHIRDQVAAHEPGRSAE